MDELDKLADQAGLAVHDGLIRWVFSLNPRRSSGVTR
jgi:hypothetical protein